MFAKGSKYRVSKSINWKHKFKILMDFVEDYARQWAKRGKEDLDTLFEWVKSVRSLRQIRIKKQLSGSMSTRSTSILKDPNVAKHLPLLHDKYTQLYLRKRKSWTIIGLFYVPLEFQPMMKNWIYHLQNYTIVLSNCAILLGLPSAPRHLFPNY